MKPTRTVHLASDSDGPRRSKRGAQQREENCTGRGAIGRAERRDRRAVEGEDVRKSRLATDVDAHAAVQALARGKLARHSRVREAGACAYAEQHENNSGKPNSASERRSPDSSRGSALKQGVPTAGQETPPTVTVEVARSPRFVPETHTAQS